MATQTGELQLVVDDAGVLAVVEVQDVLGVLDDGVRIGCDIEPGRFRHALFAEEDLATANADGVKTPPAAVSDLAGRSVAGELDVCTASLGFF